MNEQEAKDLLRRYEANQCTGLEKATVESWLLHKIKTVKLPADEADRDALEQELWAGIQPKPVIRRKHVYVPYMAAAALIIIAGIISTLYYQSSQTKTTDTLAKNIQPGSNKATLTLANGKVINLTNIQGSVAIGSQVLITNNSGNGILTYKLTADKAARSNVLIDKPEEVNTIFTPRGGQYQLILEDGTRVVLNSSSTLRFRTSFAAGARIVSLQGEAYFEVTKDTKRPFIVKTEGQTLQVLGTHFNVSAYPNETIKTTLSEGSVQLLNSSSLKKQILQPEQQALLTAKGFNVKKVIPADEMAWKDGLFVFRQTAIDDVLHQLSRWYNVEAEYTNLPNIALEAELSRKLTLADVLTGINFDIKSAGYSIQLKDGRKLEITKTQ